MNIKIFTFEEISPTNFCVTTLFCLSFLCFFHFQFYVVFFILSNYHRFLLGFNVQHQESQK